jgi:hypothetical protein
MRHLTRIRIAALTSAFFLGGAAAGFAIRDTGNGRPAVTAAHPRTQVVYQTKVRTVHVRAKRLRPAVAAPPAPAAPVSPQIAQAPQAQTAPVAVRPPARVKSRVSPTGGHRERDDAGEREGHDD